MLQFRLYSYPPGRHNRLADETDTSHLPQRNAQTIAAGWLQHQLRRSNPGVWTVLQPNTRFLGQDGRTLFSGTSRRTKVDSRVAFVRWLQFEDVLQTNEIKYVGSFRSGSGLLSTCLCGNH